jgi:hypothetical protein
MVPAIGERRSAEGLDPDLAAALARRARLAVQSAARNVRTSLALHDARVFVVEQPRMIARCAWCDRIRLGESWFSRFEAPGLLVPPPERRTTHGICDSCVSELRNAGRSR